MLLRVHSFVFSIYVADMLRSEVSGTNFGECYVITVLWDVKQLTTVGMAEQRSRCTCNIRFQS